MQIAQENSSSLSFYSEDSSTDSYTFSDTEMHPHQPGYQLPSNVPTHNYNYMPANYQPQAPSTPSYLQGIAYQSFSPQQGTTNNTTHPHPSHSPSPNAAMQFPDAPIIHHRPAPPPPTSFQPPPSYTSYQTPAFQEAYHNQTSKPLPKPVASPTSTPIQSHPPIQERLQEQQVHQVEPIAQEIKEQRKPMPVIEAIEPLEDLTEDTSEDSEDVPDFVKQLFGPQYSSNGKIKRKLRSNLSQSFDPSKMFANSSPQKPKESASNEAPPAFSQPSAKVIPKNPLPPIPKDVPPAGALPTFSPPAKVIPKAPLPPIPKDVPPAEAPPSFSQQAVQQQLENASKVDNNGYPVVTLRLPKANNPTRKRTRTRPSGLVETIRKLPPELQTDIHHFEMESYAKKYFKQPKRRFLRRAVKMETLLEWSKDLHSSLLNTINDADEKEALENFKRIQMYMGDRPPPKRGEIDAAQKVTHLGVHTPQLRDEIYCQIIKQVTLNPSIPSTIKGWELAAIVIDSFPCTKDLEPYIRSYFYESSIQITSSKISLYAAYCIRRYDARWKYSNIVKIPSREEIEFIRTDPFKGAMFGGSIEEIMEQQRKEHPNVRIPRVVAVLCDCILDSGGETVEGIFRISANANPIFEMKVLLEKGVSMLAVNQNPHVPACVLKMWFLELKEPLIPKDLYDRFIDNDGNISELSELVYNDLPDVNRNTLLYLIRFLRTIATPKNQAHTKMTMTNFALIFSPNIFRCPSEDPMTMLHNTKIESNILDIIFREIKLPDSIPGVYGVSGGG